MRVLKIIVALSLTFLVASCGQSKFRSYNGPEVTQVIISKSDRRMYLLNDQKVLKSYDVGLGFAPEGHKQFEGDGKTPEGNYTIDRRNPNSNYHLSVGISYPNEQDKAFAAEQGKPPGGDIFIHGNTGYRPEYRGDWTAGCVAVTDREIEDIYAMVNDGTPIQIQP
ncbi:MAG: murein L,D-transpeptidase family protein [Pseudorhodobacter sp.]